MGHSSRHHGCYCDRALLITAALLLLGTVVAAPVVEERYFRGFLLPRVPRHLYRRRIATHVGLFAAYPWSPWLMPPGDRDPATGLVVLLLFVRTH